MKKTLFGFVAALVLFGGIATVATKHVAANDPSDPFVAHQVAANDPSDPFVVNVG